MDFLKVYENLGLRQKLVLEFIQQIQYCFWGFNMSRSMPRKPLSHNFRNVRRFNTPANRSGGSVKVYPTRTDSKSNLLERTVSLLKMEKELNLDEYTDARMLFNAIRKGQIRLVRFILIAAPKEIVNAIDLKGKTPLMISCFLKVSWWLMNNGKNEKG